MTAKIMASRDGIGGPYVLAPKHLADSLFQHLATARLCGWPPQDAIFLGDRPTDCILELRHKPKFLEEAIDGWFLAQNIESNKSYEGDDAEDPISVCWEFETEALRMP